MLKGNAELLNAETEPRTYCCGGGARRGRAGENIVRVGWQKVFWGGLVKIIWGWMAIFCGGVANLFLGGDKAKYFGVGCPTLFVLFHNETNAS